MELGCREQFETIDCALGWLIVVFSHPGQCRCETTENVGLVSDVFKRRSAIVLRVFGYGQALVV